MSNDFGLKEALFCKKLSEGTVQCRACNRYCAIKAGERGNCGVRKNINGKLFSLVFGRTLTMEIDPVEKKPLFHFKPGSQCLGISTHGCNFHCLQCQNWNISQAFDEAAIERIPFTSPEEIVEQTLEAGVEGIAYTYTEPTVFVEYALDAMKLAHKKKLYNVWVSNGYMTREVIDAIAPYLDAINVDLKGSEKFYQEVCGNAHVRFVKENIEYLHKKKIHTEVTYLIVPGYNDNEAGFKEAAEFVKSVSADMPLHFSRFYPQFKLDYLPQTPVEKIHQAAGLAKKAGLHYVYEGNLREEENTYCWKCHGLLVKRFMYSTQIVGLKGASCAKCGSKQAFVL